MILILDPRPAFLTLLTSTVPLSHPHPFHPPPSIASRSSSPRRRGSLHYYLRHWSARSLSYSVYIPYLYPPPWAPASRPEVSRSARRTSGQSSGSIGEYDEDYNGDDDDYDVANSHSVPDLPRRPSGEYRSGLGRGRPRAQQQQQPSNPSRPRQTHIRTLSDHSQHIAQTLNIDIAHLDNKLREWTATVRRKFPRKRRRSVE